MNNKLPALSTKFERMEVKYLIPNNIIDIIMVPLMEHMELEPYSKNGFQSISSIYFDTYDWQAFYAKMDGLEHRQKFRIRNYNTPPLDKDKVYIEIKEKFDSFIIKRRDLIPLIDIKEFVYNHKPLQVDEVTNDWRYNILRNAIKPKLLNRYDRLAFESPHYPGLRVTLDRNVQYAMIQEINFEEPTHNVLWGHTHSILEIKFVEFLPVFIVDIIRRNNLTREAISKYGYSVISNYLLT